FDTGQPVPVETAEARAEPEAAAAARALLDKEVGGIVLVGGLGRGARDVIAEATRAKVPVFGCSADQVRARAVLARVASVGWGGFEAGRRAARVLKGDPPGSIPFGHQGSGYDTLYNPNVAKQLGIVIPGELLRGASAVSDGP